MQSVTPAAAPETRTFGDGNYLVWRKVGQKLRKGSPGGASGNPRFRHPTFAAAEREALRLASLFPQSTFVILHEVARVKSTAAEIVHVEG